MSKKHPTPYVAVEVVGGWLVRVCPVCGEQIRERTNEEGLVSNNFVEHYEAAHRQQEPEPQRCYLLGLQPRDDGERGHSRDALRNMSGVILDLVRKQMPEVDWQLVDRLENLPEDAPLVDAEQALRGAWNKDGDDPQLRQVRWYRREGDHLVFTPTKAQIEEWDSARQRTNDVRAALIERHRDELPEFAGNSVQAWEDYHAKRKKQEDEIAKVFDSQRTIATNQFYRGDYRWASTVEMAIDSLGISDEEVEDLRTRTQARLAEAEALLNKQ